MDVRARQKSQQIQARVEERCENAAFIPKRGNVTTLSDQKLSLYHRFKLVQLTLDHLATLKQDAARRKALNKIPPGLDETYVRILDQLKNTPDDLQIALRALTWLLYCGWPMTLTYLATAASVDPNYPYNEEQRLDENENVLDICRSLIHINIETNLVEFSHISVTEFLQSSILSNGTDNPYYRGDSEGNALLMKACFMYIRSPYFVPTLSQLRNSEILQQLRSRFRDQFSFYAVYEWPTHANKTKLDLTFNVLEFLTSNSFPSWRELWELTDLHGHQWWENMGEQPQENSPWTETIICELVSNSRLSPGTPLYYAASFGFQSVVDQLILQNHDANEFGGPKSYPLFVALENAHLDLAKSLILKGANINIQDKFKKDTALHRATVKRDKVVVGFLLEQNADLTVCNVHGHTPLDLALQTSCTQGSDCALGNDWDPEIINSLASISVNVKNNRGKTALHLAASLGCVPSTSTLLEQRADVNVTDDDGRTALHVASSFGRTEIVDMLLNNHANIGMGDRLGYTALHLAVQSGNVDMVAKLSQKLGDPLYPLEGFDGLSQTV